MTKKNINTYLIWLQFYSSAILFIVSAISLNQSPNSNSSPQMIDFALNLILIMLALCFFSLIFNMLPAAILFYRKKNIEPSSEQRILKMMNKSMIICAIVFVISVVGIITGLIIYIF